MALPASQKTPQSSQQPNRIASFRRVLTNRNFLLLWSAQIISQTIFNAANFGLVVLVENTTHSAILVSLAIVSFLLPAVPFSTLAGVIVDRLNKRRVLWVSNLLRAATMLLVVVTLLHNHQTLFPIFILLFLTSLICQFFTPAEGASIPLLVGEEELMPALSLFNITITLAQAVGFLLLGRIIATVFPPFTLHLGALQIHFQSIDMLFVIVSILYIVCSLLIFCIPKRAFSEAHLKAEKNHFTLDWRVEMRKFWHDTAEVWNIIRVDHILFFSVIQLSLAGVILQLIGILAPTFVQQILQRPAEDMAIIMAPAAVGLIGASTLMPRISDAVGKTRLTFIGLISLGVGFLLIPAAQLLAYMLDPQHWLQSPLLFWLTFGLIFALGIAMASVNIPSQTLVQEHAPEEARARVLAFQNMLFSAGSIPVLLFAGAIAQLLGLNTLLILIALCLLFSVWWGISYIRQPRSTKNS